MTNYYTAVIFLCLFAMLIIQICIVKSTLLSKDKKRIFHALFIIIMVAAFCEWFGVYLQGTGSSTRVLHIVVKAVELSVVPFIGFLVSWIIERRRKKEIYIYLAVHAVIECLSGVFGFIYYVDDNSNYMHADFHWIYIVAYMISIVYCIYTVIKNAKKYQYNGISYFILITVLMISGIVIQLYDENLKVDYFTMALVAIMLYVFTLEMIQQTDELTELINRRGYENYISTIKKDCAILFFDVDNFKGINDNCGHAFGDTVLRAVGKTIKNQYSKNGKCFRFGGDEFCVILNKNLDQVKKFNSNFFHAMARMREKDSRFPFISIGYVFYDPKNDNIQDAIEKADRMMYQYKKVHKEMNK